MRAAHTVEQVRAAEAALMARLPTGTLMQRAAAGLAVACSDLLGSVYGARVLLLIGSGDNGGDALYAGARLARRGALVSAIAFTPSKANPGGLAAFRAAGGRLVEQFTACDLVVDGVVGIGGRPGLKPEVVKVLDHVEEHAVPVVAVDVPSGVDVDAAEVGERCVRADVTVTFGTHKICHLADPAALVCGAVHLVDIGLDLPAPAVESLQAADVAALYPRPAVDAHKYTRGVVGLLVGSPDFSGAAVLAASGAVAGPAGMVRYAGDPDVATAIRARHPEVVAASGRVQSWVVGSGLGDRADAGRIAGILEAGEPTVVDADGLRFLPARLRHPALLTPHAGELARLLDVRREDVERRPLEHARAAAERWRATVLLKGRRTIVTAPDGRTRVNPTGTPWLSTAGSGDVLAGLCGALLAAGLDPLDAGSVGAWLHGAAGTAASQGWPITASEVVSALSHVLPFADPVSGPGVSVRPESPLA
ncbi:MAG: NAD(P)H-hydrate dehydratase [Propionibacteriales bacterium]|nr:NAD(P)H-hydrate dehydratase [Propionibacteriales bacterium]